MKQLIQKTKNILGEPAVAVEITDDMFVSLFVEAQNQFMLFKQLNSELTDKTIQRIEKFWVEQYFTALSKGCLGNIRGKFSGTLPLPSGDFKLDYEYLIRESEAEKTALIKILYPEYKYENSEDIVLIACYINVGNLNDSDVNILATKTKKQLNSLPTFIKPIIIPIREGSPRVELIYSNTNSVNVNNINDLYNQFKDLDSEIEKYLKKKDEE